MDVTHKTQEIAVFIAEIRSIPPLKEVANLSMFLIEILRIGEVAHLHDARYRVLGCFDQQMNVVGHEHISVKNKAALALVSVQPLKVPAAIGFVKEDVLSLIAPDDDVVKSPFKLYARFPCHARSL